MSKEPVPPVSATLGFPVELAERVLATALRESGILERIDAAKDAALAVRGLMKKPEAAKFLTLEERTLEIWMRPVGDRGGRGVPHIKIGDRVFFQLAALEAWLAQDQFQVNRVLSKVA